MHRPFSCGEAAKARALLGLTAGWADTQRAVAAPWRKVYVNQRPECCEPEPARLRGPVFGRKGVA
jgi:hypothetical protein